MAFDATLLLKVDSTQVAKGTGELDKLAAAGARAEAATNSAGIEIVSYGHRMNTAGAAASKLAANAQVASRAAAGYAVGARNMAASTKLAGYQAQNLAFQLNDVATGLASGQAPMRVLAQQSGQFYQIMQQSGMGVRGFARALLEMVGIIKVTQNAQLAAEAASAAAAATALGSVAARTAANVAAADTELALSLAAVRTAATTEALTAAQARLAAAHQAVAFAAAEATTAEVALADANAAAASTAAASDAKRVVGLGRVGAALGIITAAATLAAAALSRVKSEAGSDAEMKAYAQSLGLTRQEMKKLEDVTVTWGDTTLGVMDAILARAGVSTEAIKSFWQDTWTSIGDFAWFSAGIVLGAFAAIVKGVASAFINLGKLVANAMTGAANIAIEAFEGMVNKIIGGLNTVAGLIGKVFNTGIGTIGPLNLGRVAGGFELSNPLTDAAGQFGETFNDITVKGRKAASDAARERARNRLKEQADDLIADRDPKKGKNARKKKEAKEKEDLIAKELAQLQQQIDGLLRLAAAYALSDAAAMQAEARLKAEETALRLKGNAELFYAKELELAVAQRISDGAKLTADLRFEAQARKAANDNVAAGVLTSAQAERQLELESKLRPLVAAAANAEGAAKQRVLDVIRELTKQQEDLNDQLAREAALREVAANDDSIARLKLETELIGASNRERAVRLAQLEAEQMIRDNNIQGDDRQKVIDSAVGVANAQADYDQALKQFNDLQDAADRFASAITDVLMGTKSLEQAFSDMARSIIADIIQMTIKMLIFRAISNLFGGGGGNLFGGSFEVAKGAAFSGGNVIPFASGGIVGGPTFFPMSGGKTGLMGEAGPEAVMPLARDGQGRLGVRGGGAPVEVHVIVDVSPDLMVKAAVVADSRVRAAEGRITKNAVNATLRVASRPRLMGRG